MSGSSDYTRTAHYNLYKPSPNADDDQWGSHLNWNADTLDALLGPGGSLPFLPLSGGAMLGPLALAADPISAMQAATKQYTDALIAASGVSSFNTRTGAVALTSGDVTTALTYTPYDVANPAGYQTAAQVTTAVAPYAHNTGRNLLHNPLFNVAQRGAGGFSTSGAYGLDRWVQWMTLDTLTLNQIAMNDTARSQIGDEAPAYGLSVAMTGNAGATAFSIFEQHIEMVRRLSGKTVTLSFYAVGSAALKVGASLTQVFGFGGSPSASVTVPGQSVTVSTTWARYSLTFALPSAAGKTFGTTVGTDYTDLTFWVSAGANSNAASGGVGVQSGSFTFWGVQLEIGSAATPLEKPDPQQDLAKAQRFYQLASLIAANYGVAGSAAQVSNLLPVVMRGNPTVTPTSNANSNVSGLTLGGDTAKVYTSGATATATGTVWISQNMTLSADL